MTDVTFPIPADLSSFDGTSFSLLRPAARALRAAGADTAAVEMRDRVGDATSDAHAVSIIREYVIDFADSEVPQ